MSAAGCGRRRANTVLDIRTSGTSAASVALKWPLGAPPNTAAVCRLFMKPGEDAAVDVDHAPRGRALVVVRVVAVARQRGIGVRGDQRRGDALADLVIVQAAQQPRAPRVGRLHLERAVQLDGMADDLVRDEGVVVRIGDDDDVAVGGGQRRRLRQLDRLARRASSAKSHEGRKAHQRLVHAVGEDLPAALVADDVVELLARAAATATTSRCPA